MLTPETLEALAASRRRVDDLVEGHVESVVVSWLNAMRDVEAEVERVAAANELDANTRMQRLDIARRDIAERIATLDEEVRMNLTSEVNSYVELAAATQPELIATQLPPIGISFNRPDPEAIAWIVQRTTEQITVRHYYLSADATRAMQSALRTGVAGGINPREAAKTMLQQTRETFHGGLFRATVIARTEMLDAYRASAHETELANSEVLDGWTWWANIDNKTCISCIGMHGTDHPTDEPGPHDHHQGRCSRLPKAKSWKALGFDTVDEPDGLEFESGADWFERQPEHVQREIMGPKRYEAWQEGRFPPELWSRRVESDGWRDAHHIGNPLEPEDAPAEQPRQLGGLDGASRRQMQEYLQGRIEGRGTVVGLDAPGLSDDMIRDAVKQIDALLERYPEMSIDIVAMPSPRRSYRDAPAWATAVRDPQGGYRAKALTINTDHFKASKDPHEAARRAKATGWWNVRSDDTKTASYVIAHEFGHLVDYESGNYRAKRGRVTAVRTMDTIARARKLPKGSDEYNEFVRGQMSRYGLSEPAEGIAEAFADVIINGGAASETSTAVVEQVTEKLRARHGTH